MTAIELDITDPATIERAAAQLSRGYPRLNVLFNNAGIMLPDEAAGRIDDKLLVDTVRTNLMGPIRMTSSLIEHLKRKGHDAVIAYTSSILGFVPLVFTAVYSATKAALHSCVLSQRFLLKHTGVRVLEMAPPHRPDEQPRSGAGHAARSVHRGGDGGVRDRSGRNTSGKRKALPSECRPKRARLRRRFQRADVVAHPEWLTLEQF
jgi:short-subunit dehydrogenase involved in D-alanine esterification of teichoic acids